MTKKQYILASFLAAVPAYGLIAAMLWAAAVAGMLEDGARVSAALWVIFILTFLGGLVIGALPFAVLIFPGLMPIAAMAGAPAGSPAAQSKAAGKSKPADDEELSDSEEYSESDEYSDEFSDDAGDSFDDEPLEDFEEEDDSSKKKKKR
jgi:hypothetical protein